MHIDDRQKESHQGVTEVGVSLQCTTSLRKESVAFKLFQPHYLGKPFTNSPSTSENSCVPFLI